MKELTLEQIIDKHRSDPLLRENPFLGYFIQSALWAKAKEPYFRWLELKPIVDRVERETGLHPPSTQLMPLWEFSRLHRLLREDVLSDRYEYFVPEGLYIAAKTLARDDADLCIVRAHRHIHKPENFAAFLRMPSEDIKRKWNPHYFDMKFRDIEHALDFLRRAYKKDKERFFARYGSVSGVSNLAEDLSHEREVNVCLKKLHTLVSNGPMFSRMFGVKDKRFTTQWAPSTIFLTPQEIVQVRQVLHEAHEADPDRFYTVYGSPLGVFILSKELQHRNAEISPAKLEGLLVNSEKAQEILWIKDDAFRKRWNVKSSGNASRETLDMVTEHLSDEYKNRPTRFFTRYGCAAGPYHVAQDIAARRKEGDFAIDLGTISSVMRDGQLLSRVILGLEDKRFRSCWQPAQMRMSYTKASTLLDFLRTKYHDDAERFFRRYGSALGVYYLMKDLHDIEHEYGKPQPQAINPFVLNGERLAQFLNVKDKRFTTTAWQPKCFALNDEQIDTVAEFLKRKHKDNATIFFKRYGSETGVIALEKDLEREQRLRLSSCQLARLVKNGKTLEMLLGVEDERFSTVWDPRSIQLGKHGLAKEIGDFLRKEYDQDAMRFFIRYGGPTGQYLILRDLKAAGIRVVPQEVGSVTKKPSTVASVTGIPAAEFEGRWAGRRAYLSDRELERLIDLLKERYAADPQQFFERFGSDGGILHLAADLKKEKKVAPNLNQLFHFVQDGQIVAALIDVEDKRFETAWHQKVIATGARHTDPIVTHLRETYFAGSEQFFTRYGARSGVYALACDLRERGLPVPKRLGPLSTMLKCHQIQHIVGTTDDRFRTQWNPRDISFNLNRFENLLSHLRTQFANDEKRFFARYGGALGTIILAGEANKELGIQECPGKLSPLVGDRELLTELIISGEARLSEDWRSRKYICRLTPHVTFSKFEALMVEGIQRMASSCALPAFGTPIQENEVPYLRVRYGLRTTDQGTSLYVVELYHQPSLERAKKNMKLAVNHDKEMSNVLKSVRNVRQTQEFAGGEEMFTGLAGCLLYSFDPEVRKTTQHKLVELYRPIVERIISGKRHDDSAWDNFVEYCGTFDLYNLRNVRGHNLSFTIRKGIIGKIMSTLHPPRDSTRRTDSLDAEITQGESSTWHEVVG